MYISICIYIHIIFYILFYYDLSQDIEYSSLCYIIGPCCLFILNIIIWDFAGGLDGKESACNAGDLGLIPGSEKAMAPHSILLPGESHGRRSLVGCSPWGRYESDKME